VKKASSAKTTVTKGTPRKPSAKKTAVLAASPKKLAASPKKPAAAPKKLAAAPKKAVAAAPVAPKKAERRPTERRSPPRQSPLQRIVGEDIEREETRDKEPRKKHHRALPADAVVGHRPIVAIVGRPNIGKSTLFNRLAGERIAIVEDVPGVTRDRHYADASLYGREVVLVDTGGFDPESDDPMREGIAMHVRLALAEADAVICLLDATSAPLAADRAAIELLRRGDKPVVYVANKADNKHVAMEGLSLYELGIPSLVPVSALHGYGMPELEEAVFAALPPVTGDAGMVHDDTVPRVAIIGRPNAGKSSLVNRLLGEERQLVDSRPGTTVDPIDTLCEREGKRYVLIDTAGIRRKRGIDEAVESIAVMKAIRSIERADVVVLLIDAKEGPAEQDARLCGLVTDRGRALIIGLNKMDLLDGREQQEAIARAREVLAFADWAPIVAVSALTGRAVNKLLLAVDAARKEHGRRVPTSECNRFFEEVLDHHPPPTLRGKPVRLYYVTQAETHPPRFIVMTNEPEGIHFSYQRYVVNAIRERFGFQGTPVRVTYKQKPRRP
jgi:GTP-binding protein